MQSVRERNDNDCSHLVEIATDSTLSQLRRLELYIEAFLDPFNDWGGGDVTNLFPFWEETARKQPLSGTYLTNPMVKCDEFGASLPTM